MDHIIVHILLVLQVLTAILLTWAITAVLLAWARLRPPRLTDVKALFYLKRLTPEDLGLPFDTLQFAVPELGTSGADILLKAWFVRHPQAAGRTVVLIHGYSDAKIGAAAWLPMLHDLGVNVLLLDMPAHGESGGSITTAGWRERHQIPQVLKSLAEQRPGDCQRVVLFGISMGAAVALAAARVEPSIKGVIADSPYSDLRKACLLHATLFGLPGGLIQRPATWFHEWTLGIRYEEVAPLRLLREVECPVLLIEAGKDALVSREDGELMKDAVYAKRHRDGKSAIAEIDNAPHILGLASNPERYRAAVEAFLAGVWES